MGEGNRPRFVAFGDVECSIGCAVMEPFFSRLLCLGEVYTAGRITAARFLASLFQSSVARNERGERKVSSRCGISQWPEIERREGGGWIGVMEELWESDGRKDRWMVTDGSEPYVGRKKGGK